MSQRSVWMWVAVLASGLWAAGAESPVVLQSKTLSVRVDPAFPRILEYRIGDTAISGQPTPVAAVELNGKTASCQVSFSRRGTGAADYTLGFPNEGVDVVLRVTVESASVELRVLSIRERGAFKVKTLFFPGNALLTFDTRQPDAAIAATYCTNTRDQFTTQFREKIAPLSALAPMADTGNYFFASVGKLAVGLADNHIVDIHRTAWKVTEQGGVKTCTAWCPAWVYREIDSETVELPVARVFVTGDRNGDGKADWQDAALVYRATMPMPFGHEFVKDLVGENIAMNFASGAQQPFLRILDEVKKIWLATDGIGNQVIIKGFSSEGHDSANTDTAGHWNERAGGLRDFTVLLDEAGKYNARIGIHVNASEVYPEAHRYKPEILQRDGKGNPKGGWTWLDHAHMIDKEKDTVSGNLYAALDGMRQALPKLDCVYVDTYWENGWLAWKIASKLNSLGLPMYTEGSGAVDPWTTWAHWRGSQGLVMPFLWYSDRDLFNNDAILRSGRSDDDGFMGWQNCHNFHSFIARTFSARLPAKYLQHFDLLRWEPGREAQFSGGVRVVRTNDAVTVTQDGRTVMTWTGGGSNARLFVPWEPLGAPKIYVWDETGTEQAWDLPPAWSRRKAVYLYKLTDQGRTGETRLPVIDGRVVVKVERRVPYVIYPKRAPGQKGLSWGEGSLVKDPGFDSHGFDRWSPSIPAVAAVENDGRGNPRLILSGTNAVEVAQNLKGLEGGKTYLAGVWVQVTGKRRATLVIRPQAAGAKPALHPLPLRERGGVRGGVAVPFMNFVDDTAVKHNAPNDPRSGSNFQYLKVRFTLPKGCSRVQLALQAESGVAGTRVEFDDVRVVETQVSPQAAKYWYWEDFEHVDLGGYGPFTCCPGERTHLSEANPPYTDDTINGRFSLKSRDGGRVVRTLPCTLRFKPNTRYRLACEVMGAGRMTVEDGGKTMATFKFSGGRGTINGEFATTDDPATFLALYRDGGDFIAVDDLAIDEIGPAR